MIYWILIGLLAVFWMCGVVCILSGGRIMGRMFHKIMGWHWPNLEEPPTMEGIIITSHCRFCGKAIMLDSQGNWYTYE